MPVAQVVVGRRSSHLSGGEDLPSRQRCGEVEAEEREGE